jgi:hypothetical protein
MAAIGQDGFELTKCQLEITEFSHEVAELLRFIQHTPITFNQSDTSVQGDQYGTNTVLLNDYGRLTLGFAMDPQATNVAMYADAQIKGSKAGDKAVDSVAFFDSEGAETSRFNIERWHMEEFRIGPFNSKSSDNMEQSCTLDMEKFVRA